MAERCPDCGRQTRSYGEFEDNDGYCYAHLDLDPEVIACLRARIARLEAVVEAQAKVIELLEQTSGGGCGCPLCIRELSAAKAELERVKG